MKLLVLLNEKPVGAHDDVHRSLDYLKTKGVISDYIIYSFSAEIATGKSEQNVLKEIEEISGNFQPQLMLWMHTSKMKVKRNIINNIKTLNSKPTLGYWDGDLYQSPFRPVPSELLRLTSACDVVFLQGFGEMSSKIKKSGCNDIRFVPGFGDPVKFYPSKKNKKKEYDVVLIGNYIRSRNPFRPSMKGAKFRNIVAENLTKEYGSRFALYGNGWKYSSAKGSVQYNKQSSVYHVSRIAISINNYEGQYNFSDRLPIAMLSGIPVIHNYQEGFDKLFNNCKNITFFTTIDDLLKKMEDMLKKSDEELLEIGLALNKYALKYFTSNFVFEYMVNVMKEKYFMTNNRVISPWLERQNK